MKRKTCQNDCPKCSKCWCTIFAHWTSPNDTFCDYARTHRLTKRPRRREIRSRPVDAESLPRQKQN